MKPRLLLAGVFASLMITGLGLLARWPARADGGIQPAGGQSDLGLVHLAQVDVGGPAHAVTVQGDYAYVAVGDVTALGNHRLVVVNVSDPTEPQAVGQTEDFSYIHGIYVTGTHAFVAAGIAGLRVLDISDPTAPVEVGSYGKGAGDIFVLNSTAYVATDNEGLYILDVSDPTAPRQIGHVGGLSAGDYCNYESVIARGHYAYTAAGTCRLIIFDVSDPGHVQEVGRSQDSGPGYRDAYLSGDYIYAPEGGWHGGSSVHIIDISDPTQPQFVAAAGFGGVANGISGAGTHVYVGTYDDLSTPGGLHVLDISNPAAPQEVLFYALKKGGVRDVFAKGDTVFLAEGENGLEIARLQPMPFKAFLPFVSLSRQ